MVKLLVGVLVMLLVEVLVVGFTSAILLFLSLTCAALSEALSQAACTAATSILLCSNSNAGALNFCVVSLQFVENKFDNVIKCQTHQQQGQSTQVVRPMQHSYSLQWRS